MRNHLISVALGFVLGGLVLIPLTLQLNRGTPVSGESAAGQSSGRDAGDAARSTAERGTSVGNPPARLPAQRSDARLPGESRRPAPAPAAEDRDRQAADRHTVTARRGWTQQSELRESWRQILSSTTLSTPQARKLWGESGWSSAQPDRAWPQPRPLALSRTFDLHDDQSERFGNTGSTRLTTLPQQDDMQLLALRPPTTRIDDAPVVNLPGTTPLVPILNPTPTGRGDGSPVITAPVGNRPPIGSAVIAAGPVRSLVPYGPQVSSPGSILPTTPSISQPDATGPTLPSGPVVSTGSGVGPGGEIPVPASTPVVTPDDTAVADGGPGVSPSGVDDGSPIGARPGVGAVTVVTWGGLIVAPEPGTLALLLAGGAVFARRSRRS